MKPAVVVQKAMQDEGVARILSFLPTDRRKQRLPEAAGSDPRKRKKIEDDFTPQLGRRFWLGYRERVQRRLHVNGTSIFGSEPPYEKWKSSLSFLQKTEWPVHPSFLAVLQNARVKHLDCLGRCEEVSGVPAAEASSREI